MRSRASMVRFVMISAGFHLFVFTANGILGFFYSRPQFAVETAPTSVDVMIVEEEPPVTEEMPLPLPELTQAAADVPIKIPEPRKETEEPLVRDPVKGALVEAKPDYLRNPAPLYPREARRRSWEGLVLLEVAVSREGIPLSVRVAQSSGHVLLDKTAAQTVRGWQFLPARMGGVPVESSIRVPVRFELEYSKHL